MRKLGHLKHPIPQRTDIIRRKSLPILVSDIARSATHSGSEHTPSAPVYGAPVLPPESIVTAATVEEPLPFLMAGMALWGVAVTAVVIAPLGLIALMASPLIVAGNVFGSAR
jgi:hypothetical protein